MSLTSRRIETDKQATAATVPDLISPSGDPNFVTGATPLTCGDYAQIASRTL